MAWFWSDDIARALIESGAVQESQVQDWISQPHAVSAPDGSDPAELGRQSLEVDCNREIGAA